MANEKTEKDRIIFWIDLSLGQFCTANFFQEKNSSDIFAIIDTDKQSKSFFDNQTFVKFKNIWYLRDFVYEPLQSIDMDYLNLIEKKYGINVWSILYSDYIFYQFNRYYRYNSNELLSMVEQNCKLFEKIIDEVNPNFIMLRMTSDLSTELLHKICKVKGIQILTQNMTRIGYRAVISETTDFFDELFDPSKYLDVDIKNLDQLSAYVSQYRESTGKFIHKTQFSTWKRLKAGLKFFISYYDTSYKNYYRNFGRTRWKILLNEGLTSLRKIYRSSFLNKNSIYHIDENTKFVFFPIHFEPERAVSIAAPFYTNQIEVITQIAKSLPVGFLLYVKEHPVQKVTGWKDISFYKKILELPNVRLIHHSISSEELLKKCSLVITIAGTAGIEASFHGKPSVVLTDTQYSSLSFIHRLQKIEDLPTVIRKAIDAKVDIVELNKFVKFVFDNSFEYDELHMITELSNRFLYGGFPILDVSHKKMNEFLEEYRNVYEKLVLEYIKKINFWKTKNS